ncbi:MAG TPA: hypothetical protein VIY08_02350 [Candidatus Nitrosocosmicus sp.]
MFRFFDISATRTSLCFGSIIIQIHTNSDPAFIIVSSMIYSDFPFPLTFPRLVLLNPASDRNVVYFCYFKNDNALEVFRNDNPRKYKYKP